MCAQRITLDTISSQDYERFIELAQQAIMPDHWRRLATQRSGDTPNAIGRRLIGVGYRALYNWALLPAAFPIRRADGSVICSCWLGKECPSPGKHPLIEHSSAAMPTAPSIEQLVAMLLEPGDFVAYTVAGRTCNLALLAGQRSGGLLIGDVDPRHHGSLASLWRAGWPQDTPIEQTGGGGWHVYVRWSFDGPAPNLPTYQTGVELKGDGSQVIVSPSRHASGKHYHWVQGRAPWQTPLATLPDAVAQGIFAQSTAHPAIEPVTLSEVALRRLSRKAPRFVARAVERAAAGVDGGRHNTGLWLACQLRDLRVTDEIGRQCMLAYWKELEVRHV